MARPVRVRTLILTVALKSQDPIRCISLPGVYRGGGLPEFRPGFTLVEVEYRSAVNNAGRRSYVLYPNISAPSRILDPKIPGPAETQPASGETNSLVEYLAKSGSLTDNLIPNRE
jgi:hypothetical protein